MSEQSFPNTRRKMNSHYNLRLLLIRLLLATCIVGGTVSAPIDTEVDVNSDPEAEGVKEELLASESKLSEIIKQEPRAIPFLSSLPNPLSGKETPGAAGLPGIPNFSAALDGAKLYMGAFQILEMPKPKDVFGTLGNLGSSFPTLPGLPNPLGVGEAPAST